MPLAYLPHGTTHEGGLLRELHQKLYGDLCTWAGRYRTCDLTVGIDPARIDVELRGSLDNIRCRWAPTD